MFNKGDKLIHTQTGKKCIFKEYEVEEWIREYDCAWVIFDRIWFRRNQERLVLIGNLKLR